MPLLLIGANNSPTCINFRRKDMSKKKEKFNVTQGMTLLLLKKISLPSNLVFQMIPVSYTHLTLPTSDLV